MKALLVLAATLAVGYSHLCLLYPHQRGSENDLNKQGATDCFLTMDAPCGGRMAETPMVNYMAGMNGTVIFQKNLDHFYKQNPGMFVVSLLEGNNPMKLMTIPDSAMAPSGTLYTVNVTMPNMEMDKAVLQVTYVTNNPQAPKMFYQCADVNIKKM